MLCHTLEKFITTNIEKNVEHLKKRHTFNMNTIWTSGILFIKLVM